MTRQEVRQIIAANPGVGLYCRYTTRAGVGVGIQIGLHVPISKTRAIRNAKHFQAVHYGTFLQQRPDLNPARVRIVNDQQIVTFDVRPGV
jgi:hypothetical protein